MGFGLWIDVCVGGCFGGLGGLGRGLGMGDGMGECWGEGWGMICFFGREGGGDGVDGGKGGGL